MKRTTLVFGSIAGLIIAVFMIVSTTLHVCDSTNDKVSMLIGYAGMLAAFSFVFVGIKNFRDKHNGCSITFGKAFLLGLYITMIASTIYVFVWLIEYYCFMPDFMDKYSEHMIEKVKAAGTSGAEQNQQIKDIESMRQMYKNPLFVILITYTEILPVGLILSLISAAILRRKPKDQVSI